MIQRFFEADYVGVIPESTRLVAQIRNLVNSYGIKDLFAQRRK